MKTEFECPTCGQKFKAETINECPACAAHHASLLTRRTYLGAESDPILEAPSTKKVRAPLIQEEPRKEPTMGELIAAQNRTTHAIRALAVFFFISLRTSVVGGSFMGIGFLLLPISTVSGLGLFLIVAGWLTTLIGFFYAVHSGVTELLKSKVS
jgi:AhpD family alkylhydroperoxidase